MNADDADQICVNQRASAACFLVSSIGTLSFHDLVVNAKQQQRRYPIANEKARVLLAHQLENR
jgi:hypothetical protein